VDDKQLFPHVLGLIPRLARLEKLIDFLTGDFMSSAAQLKLFDAIAQLKATVDEAIVQVREQATKMTTAIDDGDEEAMANAAAEIVSITDSLEGVSPGCGNCRCVGCLRCS